MKGVFKSLLFLVAFYFYSTPLQAQNTEQLLCFDYWLNVDFGAYNLHRSYFDFKGDANVCHAHSNARYPFDERISIRIYNHFDNEFARKEFDKQLGYAETDYGFETVTNLGDEAFAIMSIAFDKLDSVSIKVIKGNFTIQFDISGNTDNTSNNRFTPTTVYDFARRIIEHL